MMEGCIFPEGARTAHFFRGAVLFLFAILRLPTLPLRYHSVPLQNYSKWVYRLKSYQTPALLAKIFNYI